MTAPILEVRNVSRFFGGVKANLDVRDRKSTRLNSSHSS